MFSETAQRLIEHDLVIAGIRITFVAVQGMVKRMCNGIPKASAT